MGGKTSEIPGFGWTKELRGEKFSSPVPVLFDFWVPLPPLLDFLFHSPLVSPQMLSLAGMGLLLLRGRERRTLVYPCLPYTQAPESLLQLFFSLPLLLKRFCRLDTSSFLLPFFSECTFPFLFNKKRKKKEIPSSNQLSGRYSK